jgi:hypothetical protein
VDLEAQAAGAAWSRGCELGLGSKRGRDVPSLRDSSNSSTRPTPLHTAQARETSGTKLSTSCVCRWQRLSSGTVVEISASAI